MLDTVNHLDTEVWVPTPGKMSAKWGSLVFNLPPVACMPLVHGFCRLPCVLGTACLACHYVHFVGGITRQIMSDVVGETSECTFKLLRLIQLRTE
jgi:hypothetical protein